MLVRNSDKQRRTLYDEGYNGNEYYNAYMAIS
jgi:hypothetical protein